MKQLLLVLLLLQGAAGFSQDTLFWRNGTKELIQLTEITANEVRYYRYERPDGPLYVADKATVIAIGVRSEADSSSHRLVFVRESIPDTNAVIGMSTTSRIKEQLSVEGKRIYKGDQLIDDNAMRGLIVIYPYQEIRPELSQLNRKMINNRKLSRIFLYTMIPCAAVTFESILVAPLYGSFSEGARFIGGGLVLTSSMIYLSFHFKNRAQQHRKDLVDTYNNPY